MHHRPRAAAPAEALARRPYTEKEVSELKTCRQHQDCCTFSGKHLYGGDSGHHKESTCKSQHRRVDENVIDGDTTKQLYSHDDDIGIASTTGASAGLSERSVAALFMRLVCAADGQGWPVAG